MHIKGYQEQFGDLTTLINVPQRGPYGNANYRGNYAGDVLKKLIGYLNANSIRNPYIYDPMEGGKTSRDVCTSLNLPYVGSDIHRGFDVVNDDFHDTGFDLTMLHYSYWKMIDYAADLPQELQKKDMSRMDWKSFIEAVSHVNMKAAAHSRFVAVLVGDMAVQGGIKSIQREMAWAGLPVRHIIKVQHNANSFRKKYAGKFIPIVHEHLILFKTDYQPAGEMWVIATAQYKKVDIDQYVTWRTAIKHVSIQLPMITPAELYERMKSTFPVKWNKSNTPEATIRRTLQELESEGFIRRLDKGYYQKCG